MRLSEIQTSQKQLESLAVGAGAAGWTAFVNLYRPAMIEFVRGYFYGMHIEGLDEEAIVQDVLVGLVKKLPAFHYDPAKGRFRDYLGRTLKNRVLSELRKRKIRARADTEAQVADFVPSPDYDESDRTAWRDAVYGQARLSLLADRTISQQTRDVFEHYVVRQEPVTAVAAAYDLKPNAVYQIKNRLVARLKAELAKIEEAS